MKAIFGALVLAALPVAGLAMSGREYLDHCRRETVYDRALCMGYLDAILRRDTDNDFRAETRQNEGLLETARVITPAPYCLPTTIRLSLLRDVVVRRLDQFPAQRLHGDADPLIRGILARTYPPEAICGN